MDWKMFVLYNGVHYREAIEESISNSKIYENFVDDYIAHRIPREVFKV